MDKKQEFKPYIPAEKITPDLTITSIIMGILLAVVFGAANAYLGLRVGMTVSASIPAAVIAMGVIRALQDMNLRVPDDVSVVGYDGIEMSKFFIPRITTVEQPVDAIARESVHMLMDMLENGAEPTHVVVDAQLKIRESVQ